MTVKLTEFKPEEYLTDAETQAYYLEEALSSGDIDDIREALGTIAKARGVETLATEIGMTKQGLYKAFGKGGDPKLSTITKVAEVLGVRLTLVSAANQNEQPFYSTVYDQA